MTLAQDQQFMYGGIRYTVHEIWFASPGVVSSYTLVSQDGIAQNQLAYKIHAHIDSGAIVLL